MNEDRFKNKAAAIDWYKEKGGALEQASLYKKIPCFPDKTVSRLWMSEFLREEKEKFVQKPVEVEQDERRRAAELKKAEADAGIAEMKYEDTKRALDDKWQLREDAEETCIELVEIAKDAFRHRVYLDHVELIVACGGDLTRAAQFMQRLQDFGDQVFDDVNRSSGMIVEFEDDDEEYAATA